MPDQTSRAGFIRIGVIGFVVGLVACSGSASADRPTLPKPGGITSNDDRLSTEQVEVDGVRYLCVLDARGGVWCERRVR